MNPEEQDFEMLKKLLAVKRHEQPPPGYFNQLPNQVWKRIEAKEAQPTFWERILPAFASKPAVAYSFGLIVCGALIVTIGSALHSPDSPSPVARVVAEPLAISPVGVGVGMNDIAPQQGNAAAGASSTNPVFNSGAFKPSGNDFAPVNSKPQ